MPSPQERLERSHAVEQAANTELRQHTPAKDVHGELICVVCADAAPCPRARALMGTIYNAVRTRIVLRAKGLI